MNQLPPSAAPAGAQPPSAETPGRSPRRPWLALWGIFGLLLLFALYLGRDVLVPIAVALVLNLLLSPLVEKLRRIGVPHALGGGVVVVILLGGLIWGVYGLSSPAAQWVHKAPQSLAEIERKVRVFKVPIQEVSRATKGVENLAQVAPPGAPAPTVVREHSLTELVLSGTTLVIAQVVVVIILLYFLLASGDVFMRRLVQALSCGQDKRRAVQMVRAVQRDVTIYLGTVTLVNSGLGAATAIAMAVIGMPNPALWGVVAGALNFIPYVGALTTTLILAVVGILSFDRIEHALLAPVVFQCLTNIEANLVTPSLLGRNLSLNPALVFTAVVLWSWMWGVPGALLAVPILVTLKICADHIKSLTGVSVFLGRRDYPDGGPCAGT